MESTFRDNKLGNFTSKGNTSVKSVMLLESIKNNRVGDIRVSENELGQVGRRVEKRVQEKFLRGRLGLLGGEV